MRSLALVAVLVLASCDDSDRITGRVVDQDGAPVAGARVTIPDTAFATETNAAGEFALDYSPGSFRLRIEGYDIRTILRELTLAQQVAHPLGDIETDRVPPEVAAPSILLASRAEPLARVELVHAQEHVRGGFLPGGPINATYDRWSLPTACVPTARGGAMRIAAPPVSSGAGWVAIRANGAAVLTSCTRLNRFGNCAPSHMTEGGVLAGEWWTRMPGDRRYLFRLDRAPPGTYCIVERAAPRADVFSGIELANRGVTLSGDTAYCFRWETGEAGFDACE